MKLRKKMTAILLTAILMISAFALAVSAELYDAEQEDGKGTVELVEGIYTSETHSAKLTLPAPIVNEDEARVKFDYDSTLDSLNIISFYARLEVSFTSGDGLYTPYITMSIDRDDNGDADAWLVHEPHPKIGVIGTWDFVEFDDTSSVAVAHAQTGGPFDDWLVSPEDAMALKDLKDLSAAVIGNPEKTWGDCTVLEVKVGVGTTGDGLPTEYTLIAYVDDVTINGEPYDLELPPTPKTKREALKAKGVTGEGIDEALGLGKPLPNENFAGRARKAYAYGHRNGNGK